MAVPCLQRLRIAALLPNKGACLLPQNNRICRKIPLTLYSRSLSNDMQRDRSPQQLKTGDDPGQFFIQPSVQDILKRLTGLNLDKVYQVEPSLRRTPPRYEFMTEKQLQQSIEDAKQRAAAKLQMPPVLKAREPIVEIISEDTELIGYGTSKFLFVDISHGFTERTRTIVARDYENGTLRKATWEERDKMNKMFYPIARRKFGVPRMFQEEYFKNILDAEVYEFILDRACLQFEPDDPQFIKICHMTYDHIDQRQKYDVLHSTRHYGPMAFYYAFYAAIDNLVINLMQKNRLDEAVDVVRLFCLVKPNSKTAASDLSGTPLSIIKAYMRSDSVRPSNLELVVQTCEEIQLRQQQHLKDLEEAHGRS